VAVSGFIEVISLEKLFKIVISNCHPIKFEHPARMINKPIK
jgi:hypothetical protein